jgi:hypothetical protein
MCNNNQEIRDLLARLNLDEDQVRTTLHDIRQGDNLMSRHDQLPVDPAVLARTKTRIRQQPLSADPDRTDFGPTGDNQPSDFNELNELLANLDLSEDQVRTTLHDIQQGDDLMRLHDQLPIDPAVLTRTKARLQPESIRSQPRPTRFAWPQRAAVQAAALILALGLTIYWSQQNTPKIHPDYLAGSYWQQALIQENDFDRNINDMKLSEVLKCWSEVQWEVDDILDPDSDSEPNPINQNLIDVSTIAWIGPDLCQ